MLRKQVGNDAFIFSGQRSPLSLACELRGIEQFMMELITDTDERGWVSRHLRPLVGLVQERGSGEGGSDEGPAAWRRFLEAVAADRPLVLVFEDVHWAGAALLEFVEYLVDWATGLPSLVVCTTRPELFERNPGWGGGKRDSTTISLDPLSREETAHCRPPARGRASRRDPDRAARASRREPAVRGGIRPDAR